MSRAATIRKAAGSHWIQGAIKHPGSFKKAASAHGESTHEYAEEKKDSKGTVGRRARLALKLMSFRKKK